MLAIISGFTLIANLVQAYVILIMFPMALLSWFRVHPDSALGRYQVFCYRATEPLLRPIRKVVKPMGGLDLSFMVVMLAAEFVIIPVLGGATIL